MRNCDNVDHAEHIGGGGKWSGFYCDFMIGLTISSDSLIKGLKETDAE